MGTIAGDKGVPRCRGCVGYKTTVKVDKTDYFLMDIRFEAFNKCIDGFGDGGQQGVDSFIFLGL